jgi:hypothetical protein
MGQRGPWSDEIRAKREQTAKGERRSWVVEDAISSNVERHGLREWFPDRAWILKTLEVVFGPEKPGDQE